MRNMYDHWGEESKHAPHDSPLPRERTLDLEYNGARNGHHATLTRYPYAIVVAILQGHRNRSTSGGHEINEDKDSMMQKWTKCK